MHNIEMSIRDIVLLNEIIARYYHDIRHEIAFADSKDLRDFLMVREEFMRNLMTRLEEIEMNVIK